MPTANVAMLLPNGKIASIYVNKNGDPDHLGQILSTYYTSQERVNALMHLGSALIVGKKLEQSTLVSLYGIYKPEKHPAFKRLPLIKQKQYLLENNDHSIFYQRELHELDATSIIFPNEESWIKSAKQISDYAYLFDFNNRWIQR